MGKTLSKSAGNQSKPRRGRPRVAPPRRGNRIFDSIRAASKALAVPYSVMRGFKAEGCGAFRTKVVHENELLKWLAKLPPERMARLNEKYALQCRFLLAKLGREEIAIGTEDGKLVLFSDIETWMSGAAMNIRAESIEGFRNNLPMSLEGLRVQEIRTHAKAFLNRILAHLEAPQY